MGFERGLGQAVFHELLLLHELGVGAVVYDVGAEDGDRERAVDLLCVDVFELAVQDEFVALDAEVDGCFLAEEDEGEDIAVLGRKVS